MAENDRELRLKALLDAAQAKGEGKELAAVIGEVKAAAAGATNEFESLKLGDPAHEFDAIKIGAGGAAEGTRAYAEATAEARAQVSGLGLAAQEARLAQEAAAVAAAEAGAAAIAAREAEAVATAEATAALTAQGVAAREVETILEQKARIAEAASVRELDAQGRLQEANIAAKLRMQELGEAAVVGGRQFVIALGEAKTAVAELERAQEHLRSTSGGFVSDKQVALLKDYDRQIESYVRETDKAEKATREVSIASQTARGNLGGLAQAFKGLGGIVGNTVLGFLAFEGISKILPTVFTSLAASATALGNIYAEMTGGIVDATHAEEKLNAELAKSDQAHKLTADTAATILRAQFAVNAGLIQETDNLKLLAIEELAREGRLRGTINTTKDFAEAVKGMGIKVAKSFEDMSAEQHTFIDLYETILTQRGPAAAERFAVMNKKFMQEAIESASEAGEKLTPAFQKLVDKLDLVSASYEKQEKALDKINKKIRDHEDALKKNAAQLAEHAREIQKHADLQTKAADLELRAVQKGLDEQIAALNAARRQGTVTEREYAAEYARLQSLQIDARRAWERETAQINQIASEKMAHFQTMSDIQHQTERDNIEKEKIARGDLEIKIEKAHQEEIRRAREAQTALDEKLVKLKAFNVEAARIAEITRSLAETPTDLMDTLIDRFSTLAGSVKNAFGLIKNFVGLIGVLNKAMAGDISDLKDPTLSGGPQLTLPEK